MPAWTQVKSVMLLKEVCDIFHSLEEKGWDIPEELDDWWSKVTQFFEEGN